VRNRPGKSEREIKREAEQLALLVLQRKMAEAEALAKKIAQQSQAKQERKG
jgi:hypothetical protein